MTYDEKEAARRVVLSAAEDIDFMGVGEYLGDEWTDLPEDDHAAYDARMLRIHNLALSATVTVSWPDEEEA